MIDTRFIYERLCATKSVQEVVAGKWLWAERTVADWVAMIRTLEEQQEAVADANARRTAKLAVWANGLEALRRKARQVATMARVKFREQSPALSLFAGIDFSSDGRLAITESIGRVASAWQQAAPGWEPVAGWTLAGFQVEYDACEAAKGEFLRADAAWQNARGTELELARQAREWCVGWYRVATALFGPGTEVGNLVRSQVPTEYSPAAAERQRKRRAAKRAAAGQEG